MIFFLNQNGTCTRQDTDHIYQGSNNASKVIAITSVSPIQTFVQVAFTLPNSLTYGYLPMAYKGAYQVGGDTDNQMYLYELDLPYNVTEVQGEVGVSFNVVNSVTGANMTSYTNTFTVEYSALPIPPASASESELEQILNLLNAYYAQNTGIITTHTSQIQAIQTEQAQQNEEIEKLKEASVIGETPVGTLPSSATMPTDTEIQAYYAQNVGREPRVGDVFFFTQTLPSGYKVYKYIYGATGWAFYEIPGANVGSNPNILDNPDFAINQRGQAEYNETNAPSSAYTVDRVVHYVNNPYTLTPQTDGGIIVTTTSSGIVDFVQIIENGGALYGNHIQTLSMSLTVGDETQIITCTGMPARGTIFLRAPFPNGIGNLYGEWTVANTYKMWFRINASQTIKINWWKLELGSVATMFTPPNPAEELAKCQRYYWIQTQSNAVFNGFSFSNTQARIAVNFPVTMRISPTMELSNEVDNAKIYISGQIYTPTHIQIHSFNGNGVNIEATMSNIPMNNALGFRFLQSVSFDAEL